MIQPNRGDQVPDEHWMTAAGYLAADLILNDFQTYLVEGVEPPSVR